VRRDPAQLIDAVVLLLVSAIVVIGVAVRADPSTRPLAFALSLPAVAVLVLRRRAPTLTLAASGGLVLALFALDHSAGTIAVVAPAAALYSLALVRGRGHLVIGAVGAAIAVIVADTFLAGRHNHTLTFQTIGHVALVAVPVFAGEALRNHRSYIRLLLERLQLAEQTREEEAQRRAEQERLRIARELHDVVAHTLTTINVQAAVANHLLDRDPGHARGALTTIESASHEALEELRTILGILRDPSDDDAPLQPAPGLAAVEALIEQARRTGEVDFTVEGEQPERVPEAVQLAAFRILQESLTNTRRHAPGEGASVTLTYAGDQLRLRVENEVHGETGEAHNGNGGVGIAGMRERATALGGNLRVERTDGRFRVAAQLPYRRAP
jgi:signal transduction histidine kinase